MRFILGMVAGAVLMVGSAYVHDTRMTQARTQQFVNWDTVIGLIGR